MKLANHHEWQDEFGNIVIYDAGVLSLRLKRNGEIRALGTVAYPYWHVIREPQDKARGQGHWHFGCECWLLNYHVLSHPDFYGFNIIHFIGYDLHGKRHEIFRSVADALATPQQRSHHYIEQGFEKQWEFPIDPKVIELPRVEMLLDKVLPLCWKGQWLTVEEMMELTKLHPSSIRWCMRQCKTGPEGDFIIRRRRREPSGKNEFYIKRKPAQLRLPYESSGEKTA